jgi:hypothetical protein
VNGQIQYGPARPMNLDTTRPGERRPRLADPERFESTRAVSPEVIVLILGAVAFTGMLVALPREGSVIVLSLTVGGAWLTLVLAVTLPSRPEQAGEELARRMGRFRDAIHAVGDVPTQEQLTSLLRLAHDLALREEEIPNELTHIRAAVAAVSLREQIERGHMPVVAAPANLPAGDECHFTAPVRFGRRRADQLGDLFLTSGWLQFRGVLDLSVAWSEIAGVQRAGSEVIVTLRDSRRALRFCCLHVEESARAGVIAEYLASAARQTEPALPARVHRLPPDPVEARVTSPSGGNPERSLPGRHVSSGHAGVLNR